jgi:hypothetical protein
MSSEVLAGLGNGAPLFDNSITNDSSSTVNPSWGGSPIPRANPCDDPPMKGKNGFNQQQHRDQGLTGNVPAGTPAGLKELKETWKQYMKTPFSGRPLTDEHHPAGSPKRERGLSHVVSLPSVKTHSSITVVGMEVCRRRRRRSSSSSSSSNSLAGPTTPNMVGMLRIRMHNHSDDLRSYEQAVLSRRAPLTLHFASRHRGNSTSTVPAATYPPPPPAASATAPAKGNRASPARCGGGGDRSMSTSSPWLSHRQRWIARDWRCVAAYVQTLPSVRRRLSIPSIPSPNPGKHSNISISKGLLDNSIPVSHYHGWTFICCHRI